MDELAGDVSDAGKDRVTARSQGLQEEHDLGLKPVVLFVSHDASRTGAPLCLTEFLEAISRQDTPFVPALFVTGDGPLLAEWHKHKLQFVVSKKRARAGSVRKVLCLIFSTVAYVRLLRSTKPRLIYSNTIRNGLEVIVGRLLGVRTLVHVHEGEQIMRRYSLSFRVSSLFTSRFVCASRYSAASLKKVVGREASVIHNGVAIERSVVVSDTSLSGGGVTLGMVGGIQPNKGQLIAIQALGELRSRYRMSVRLRVYGEVEDAEYGRALDQAINMLGLTEVVEFCGSVGDRPAIYGGFDALVLASYDESFPRVLLEALRYGKPVIATDVGGVPEIVTHNETGFLVPPGDPGKLADAIARLASQPDCLRRMKEAGVRDVKERFNLDNTMAGLRALVESALV